ncbi:ABC transporter permease [Pendulispora brunnea]|uniref:ABC transporter permease n=1 Tax=Pendulispora brunnea TaxID=2905690 RepID=A0ABZ2KHN4_9BACT
MSNAGQSDAFAKPRPGTSTSSASSTWAWSSLLGGSRGPAIGLFLLCVVLSFATPYFLTFRNLLNVLDQVTILGILAVGGTAVIVIGGIDLSVGAVLALAMMVLGWLSHDAGLSLGLSAVAAVLVAALCGLANGLSITLTRLPPFIATLAMMSIARGVANVITDGKQIVGYPSWFFNLSSHRYLGFLSVTGAFLVLLYIAAWAFMRYRVEGRALYALGGSAEVARLSGIRVKLLTVGVYVVAGTLAGVAGVVLAMRLDSSQPSAGNGYELDTIAAIVIGGASLRGGVGQVGGTIVGVLIIGVLRNGLNLLGVSPFVQQVVIGFVIALAVMFDALRQKSPGRQTH